MKVVLVLEDMQVRVDWLRDLVGDRASVLWCADVAALLAVLRGGSVPDLVILDHDLGGIPRDLDAGSRDKDGRTGLDAAEDMPPVECPVLVWSVNPVRAPIMVETLRRRGMQTGWAPFRTTGCTAAITRALLRGAA